MLGSTRLTLTQSCSSTLGGCLVGAIPINDVFARERTSIIIAFRIFAEKLGLILGPKGIGWAHTT
jgi:hypothetical protein